MGTISLMPRWLFPVPLVAMRALSGTLNLGLPGWWATWLGALYYVILLVLRSKSELLSYLGMDAAAEGYPLLQLPSLLVECYKQAIAFSSARFGQWLCQSVHGSDLLAPLFWASLWPCGRSSPRRGFFRSGGPSAPGAAGPSWA